MAAVEPYPAYRDSGVEWLGEVPEHWEVRRLKGLLACVDVRSEAGEEELLTVSSERGVVPRDSASVTMFKAESYVGHKLCWPGDLVINSLWAWSRGLGVSQRHGIVSTAYGVYRPRGQATVDSAYLHTLVRSVPFRWELTIRSKGIWISRLQLTDEAFLRAPIPLPPLPEQRAIARFLDDADRRIRRYIRAKERLIELLEEERQATVHEAVTGRIDVRTGRPYPAYKDSGVEWLGKVPEHWEVRRLGTVAGLRVSNVDKHVREGEPPVRLCNYLDVYHNERIAADLPFMAGTATGRELRRFRLAVGDVLVTKDSEDWSDIGVPALVEYAAHDLVCGYHLAMLRPDRASLDGGYLFQALKDSHVAWQCQVAAAGVTRYGLSQNAIRSLRIPLPPLPEQRSIARHLDDADRRLSARRTTAERQIALLREYRTRLIADVVTGKIDVRDAAARRRGVNSPVGPDDRKPASPQASALPQALSK